MGIAVAAERVRQDVEVLSRAGLDIETFLMEAQESISRAIPHIATCIGTTDPFTHLLTGTYKFGDLHNRDERDHEWGLLEYGRPEPTSFIAMSESGVVAASVATTTGGRVERSERMREFIVPFFGFTDELRVVMRNGGQLWGGMSMFRGTSDAPFTADEVALATTLSPLLGAGIRAGLLVRHADATHVTTSGPAVIVIGRDDRIAQMSVGAEERLRDLLMGERSAAPDGIVAGLVGSARRFGSGGTDAVPRCRIRSRSGMWYVLHASPLAARSGPTGDVVVTIEEARPPETVPLVVAAFNLTERERDVAQLVLQGVDTKEIASSLHVSTYTVQDHLKSVFDKADVRSRRELIARVFFDQYVPRMGNDVAASGWLSA